VHVVTGPTISAADLARASVHDAPPQPTHGEKTNPKHLERQTRADENEAAFELFKKVIAEKYAGHPMSERAIFREATSKAEEVLKRNYGEQGFNNLADDDRKYLIIISTAHIFGRVQSLLKPGKPSA
jgi:hypothetical protein